eukprot:9181030-Pyramimonas_sp.AAC.1
MIASDSCHHTACATQLAPHTLDHLVCYNALFGVLSECAQEKALGVAASVPAGATDPARRVGHGRDNRLGVRCG